MSTENNMNAANQGPAPESVWNLLRRRWWLWVGCPVLAAVAAVAYGVMKPPAWQASQALVLRDEAASRQGKFESADARKSAQEMILELARNQSVVAESLRRLGPTAKDKAEDWPSREAIEQTQGNITIAAPKGSELGRSEVVYLSVRQTSAARAVALVDALCELVDAQLVELRKAKVGSVIAELEKSVQVARAARDQVTQQLESFEREVGGDLGDLRTLHESGMGESNLRQTVTKIKEELRQAQSQLAMQKEMGLTLAQMRDDPNQLVATPNQLLESQPALRKLKEGLIDAQLRTAQVLGKMTAEHPLAQATLAAEGRIKQDLRSELDTALAGVNADVRVSEGRVAQYEKQVAEVGSRMDRLAGLRVRYGNLVAEARQRSQVLDEAEKALAEARGAQSAARSGGMISRIDAPQTSDRPLGPGLTTIALCGGLGGLAAGFGLLVLTSPNSNRPGQGRRWSDYLPRYGRRQSDDKAGFGRRATDGQPAPRGRRADDRSRETPTAAPPAMPGIVVPMTTDPGIPTGVNL